MTIRDELEALTDTDGKLRAERVVAFGKANRDSLIGKKLEWNNGKAAHQWRLLQARQMVEIHLFWRVQEPQYISLRIDRAAPGGGYRRVSDILERKDLLEYMLDDAMKDLEHARRRYDKIKALGGVWRAVDKVTARRKRTTAGGTRKKPGRPVGRRKSA